MLVMPTRFFSMRSLESWCLGEIMEDDTIILIGFICFLCIIIGVGIGGFAAQFSIPTMKIWNSNRTYDHILLADTVMCVPANEVNASYWNYETVVYNQTEYVFKKRQIDNSSVKGIIVCEDKK